MLARESYAFAIENTCEELIEVLVLWNVLILNLKVMIVSS